MTNHMFLTPKAVYLLVVNITKPLHTRLETYRLDTYGAYVPDKTYPQTAQDYIEYWMNCIYSQSSSSCVSDTPQGVTHLQQNPHDLQQDRSYDQSPDTPDDNPHQQLADNLHENPHGEDDLQDKSQCQSSDQLQCLSHDQKEDQCKELSQHHYRKHPPVQSKGNPWHTPVDQSQNQFQYQSQDHLQDKREENVCSQLQEKLPEMSKHKSEDWLQAESKYQGLAKSDRVADFPREQLQCQPQVIIVCTHTDKASGNADTFVAELKNIIDRKPYGKHVYKYLTISNKYRDEADVKALKDAIGNLAKAQIYEMPLSWIRLKETIKEEHVKKRTFRQACAFGNEAGMTEKDVRRALSYLHTVGEVIYFDEPTIREYIITDPQWFIDQMKKVITISSLNKKEGLDLEFRRCLKQLESLGILRKFLVEHLLSKERSEYLTTVMTKFALLLPMPNGYRLDIPENQYKGEKIHLVPCLLPPNVHRLDLKSEIPSVALKPTRNFIPVGLTSRLIACLINENGWQVEGKIYRSSATFLPEGTDSDFEIAIQQTNYFIELQGKQRKQMAGSMEKHFNVILAKLTQITKSVCPMQPFEVGTICHLCETENMVKVNDSDGQPTFCDVHVEQKPPGYDKWFKRPSQAEVPYTNAADHQDRRNRSASDQVMDAIKNSVPYLKRTLDYASLSQHLTGIAPKHQLLTIESLPTREDKISYLLTKVMPGHSASHFVMLAKAIEKIEGGPTILNNLLGGMLQELNTRLNDFELSL